MSEQQKWNEAMVAAVLAKKWGGTEYAFLRQVRNQTGFGRQIRTADALAMGLWPSRGMYLHGFEVKVSRSDWAHELKEPEKAEEIARFCHFWWLAVPDKAIVKEGELPVKWGLVEVGSGTPVVIKQAPFTETPQPPTIEFFASLMRSVASEDTALADVKTLMQKEIWAAEERGRKSAELIAESQTKRQMEEYGTLKRSLEQFEKASGIRIDRYSEHFSGEIGKAVNFLWSERGIVEAVGLAKDRLSRLVAELGDVQDGIARTRGVSVGERT